MCAHQVVPIPMTFAHIEADPYSRQAHMLAATCKHGNVDRHHYSDDDDDRGDADEQINNASSNVCVVLW